MDIKLDVNQALEDIAKGLGVAVEKIYPVLYKQAIIDGVMNLFWVALIALGVFLYLKCAKYAVNRINKGVQEREKWSIVRTDWSDYPGYVMLIVFGGIAAFVFTIIGMCLFEDSITAFFNTEYYMVEKVLAQIKSN